MAESEVSRRLAAVFAADMVGYSRLIELDEEGTIARQKSHRKSLIDPTIKAHNGRIVKTTGDGMLVEFASVVDAVRCAIEIQQEMLGREADVPEDRRIRYRIGVNLGDIVIDGDDILGDGVNVAARLEALAEPGGLCISGIAYEGIGGKLEAEFEDSGEQRVKNISRPIRVWRWADCPTSAATQPSGRGTSAAPRDRPSIAVLAFNNMSGDPDQEYFSDGIAEDIITGLSYIKDLLVIARNSSFTYKGQSVEVRQVGEELGVRYVLEGSVRRGGDRIRVTAQLIDTLTGGHVWADRYDGTLDDVFALQDEITEKVLSAVGAEITLAEIQRARSERSDNVDAWDRYLQALPHYYALDKPGYEEATRLLREAIEIDPRFSSAYAILAQCYVNAGFHAWEPSAREAISKAEECARKAVALDPQDPLAHVALGVVHDFKTEPDRAVSELNRALELNPNLSSAYGNLTNALAFLGRADEALIAADRAKRGSPRDPERYLWYTGIMNAHFAAERYEECVEAGRQAVLLQPNFYGAHFVLAMALPFLGRIEEAKRELQMALDVMPRLTLENTARNPMFVGQEVVARMLEGLRKAGLRD